MPFTEPIPCFRSTQIVAAYPEILTDSLANRDGMTMACRICDAWPSERLARQWQSRALIERMRSPELCGGGDPRDPLHTGSWQATQVMAPHNRDIYIIGHNGRWPEATNWAAICLTCHSIYRGCKRQLSVSGEQTPTQISRSCDTPFLGGGYRKGVFFIQLSTARASSRRFSPSPTALTNSSDSGVLAFWL